MDDVYTDAYTDDDDDDDTDDDNDDEANHKNDGYTAAGAVPDASVPCSLFIYRFRPVKLRHVKLR